MIFPIIALLTTLRHTPAGGLFIRPNVYGLAPGDPELVALVKGVAAMKARPASDPTSWTFQANMHGSKNASNPMWGLCQHGSYFFEPWHRMYLYYFERILRKASGDPSFALPYWDWSKPGQGALPPAFRLPASAANPLYTKLRDPKVGAGAPLPPSLTSYAKALSDMAFDSRTGSALSFGGQVVATPGHYNPHGALERQPHDGIHVAIGGESGLMGDIDTAAQDPIFWLHHANIDRLWNRWIALGGGRKNPVDDATWMGTKFSFYDENGAKVTMSAKDVLDTQVQLGYRYDDDPPAGAHPPLGLAPKRTVQGPRQLLAASAQSGYRLGTTPLRVALASLDTVRRGPASESSEKTYRYALSVEGLQVPRQTGDYYEVYLDLPAGAVPDYRSPYYAGNLTFFGLTGQHGGRSMSMDEGPKIQEFDVTDAVAALKGRGAWRPQTVSVTFVRRRVGETNAPDPVAVVPITFARVAVHRIPIRLEGAHF